MPKPTLTVIIVTLDRPQCLRRCLRHLQQQTVAISQTIVVDGHPNGNSESVVHDFEGVTYIHNADGFGRMTASRNMGLEQANGDIVAYLDDDAYASREWAAQILLPYSNPTIGAVGGQALNGTPGERITGGAVGRITKWGEVTGNFSADVEGVIDVDHLMGCNMSFRRDLVVELGGFVELYPNGQCSTFEEVDLCMRIRKFGRRLKYNSRASVVHEGAPRRVGARGDINYVFGATRNLLTILLRNRGIFSTIVPAFIAFTICHSTLAFARDFIRSLVRFLAAVCGILAAVFGLAKRRSHSPGICVDRIPDVISCPKIAGSPKPPPEVLPSHDQPVWLFHLRTHSNRQNGNHRAKKGS